MNMKTLEAAVILVTMKWIMETMLELGTGNEYYYREEDLVIYNRAMY